MNNLEAKANAIRVNILNCIGSIGVGHIGGCLSVADVLAVLYFKHMNIDPKNPKWEGRDKFVMSKGHAGPALYSALAEAGYFDKSLLLTLNQNGTQLPSHCDMNKTAGVDFTAGSLGQGFSVAVGMAIGAKIKGESSYVYAILGDGESQEGQIWEAGMLAAQQRLNNLIAFTDNNLMQIDGMTDEIVSLKPLAKKWEAFGFNVYEVDGHDVNAIDNAILGAKACKDKPSMIILNTTKGKGVSFVEAAKAGSHSMSFNREQIEIALKELGVK